ncbi:MAG: XRE family transcriptional regulator [Verrucomicrobiota bacterium]|jgi:ribosome-binding protein aMBF1 (putative translation factor)
MNLPIKHSGEHTRPRVSQSATSPTASSVAPQAPTTINNHSDAEVILDRMAGESLELRRLTEEARINAAVAQLIYSARTKTGLSQSELAEKLGTRQPVISRLEDADYEGHSLSMLQRIAAALGQRLVIRFLPPAKALRRRRADAAFLEPVS